MNYTEPVILPGASCKEWRNPQNLTFHLGMIAFAAALLVPVSFKHYVVTLRCLLLGAIALLIAWGAIFWCTWDVVCWGTVFLIQNLAHLTYALYGMRRVRFPAELEELYKEIFEVFGVSRHEFKSLVNQNCKWVNIFPGDKYAVENYTTVEARVSLLVAGCMRVTQKGIYLHDVKEKQLIDSVEWESTKLKRGELFQVTVEAIDRCFYLCWNREKLQYYLHANPNLHTAFEYIRGKDIIEKVYQTAMNGRRRTQHSTGGEKKDVTATDIRHGLAVEDPAVIYQ